MEAVKISPKFQVVIPGVRGFSGPPGIVSLRVLRRLKP
jgi:hypothetical protein